VILLFYSSILKSERNFFKTPQEVASFLFNMLHRRFVTQGNYCINNTNSEFYYKVPEMNVSATYIRRRENLTLSNQELNTYCNTIPRVANN
jgi:hypothetical protein